MQDAEALSPSGPADPARERARLSSARSLALDARMLCAAAQMLDDKAQGLDAARKSADDLSKKLWLDVKPAPIDAAMRARADCLAALTLARRAKAAQSTSGKADELLSQLSAMGGWAPQRDERGVVVTLRDLFRKDTLTPEASTLLQSLAKVATAHPEFPVQVLVHGPKAGAVTDAEQTREKSRGQAVAKAFADNGAKPDMVRAEVAGGAHPVASPELAKAAARNERVEIIFVDPGG
jgi:outer membrane protein OmpA-like peptidoglycan-associated protein